MGKGNMMDWNKIKSDDLNKFLKKFGYFVVSLDQLAQLQLDAFMSKLYSGAEIVFKCLEDQDVEFIFGYPGGAVLPIYDELKSFFNKTYLSKTNREGHAAEGYARSCGKPGVVLVTSGPGATNVVTALTDAYGFCSISMYFWTSANTFNWYRCFSKCAQQVLQDLVQNITG